MQLTDFENAAFVVFVVLLTRAILSFKLNFYIPISKVGDELSINFPRLNQKIWSYLICIRKIDVRYV